MSTHEHDDDSASAAAQRVAERVRARMAADDAALALLGMSVGAVAPGRATVEMTVRPQMLNGHATCHGGLLAALADTAFAYACNSHNELTVASGFSIDLVAPARQGDQLRAVCAERSKAGRTGLYDVTVTNQRGETVAWFRGRSYTAKGRVLVDAEDAAASRRQRGNDERCNAGEPS